MYLKVLFSGAVLTNQQKTIMERNVKN